MPDINGIPYVESDDLVSAYPAVSQSLAQELSDQLAAKVPYAYGTATPSTTVEGFVWFDENDTPPTPKFWDGSAFVPFPSGAGGDAVISSPAATGQYTDTGITYDYYTFTASGTLTVDTAGFADVLVVGGGGGGGSNSYSGGGGAGGHLEIASAYLPAGTLTVTVGAGGARNAGVAPRTGAPGQTSRFSSYYGVGGGPGAGTNETQPAELNRGGSGGGGQTQGGVGQPGGTGVGGQGNNGGTGGTANAAGGGGGGAGAVGQSVTTANGGNGGSGVANAYTGSSVTRAGGGGGTSQAGSPGSGGSGGGGAASTGTGTSGTANTGGGGGAGNSAGGNGGSGVVIVRVKV